MAIKGVTKVSWGGAAATVLIPAVIFGCICGCLAGALSFALRAVISNAQNYGGY
jgi:hypothetical protein